MCSITSCDICISCMANVSVCCRNDCFSCFNYQCRDSTLVAAVFDYSIPAVLQLYVAQLLESAACRQINSSCLAACLPINSSCLAACMQFNFRCLAACMQSISAVLQLVCRSIPAVLQLYADLFPLSCSYVQINFCRTLLSSAVFSSKLVLFLWFCCTSVQIGSRQYMDCLWNWFDAGVYNVCTVCTAYAVSSIYLSPSPV